MSKRKRAVGKGLGALLSNIESEVNKNPSKVVSELSNTIATIPVTSIEPNPFQPRVDFDEQTLTELSDSIKIHGLVQPITVRRLSEGKYQLISGERRWRASQRAKLSEIPAYIRLANDQEMLEMALIENIQRQELNAIEVAISYKRLMDECNLTQEKVSEQVSKKRSTVTNYLRLLKLPPEIQKSLKDGQISMGHARALVGIEDIAKQLIVFEDVIAKNLSVRATEALIKQYNSPKTEVKEKVTLPDEYEAVAKSLRTKLGSKVALKLGKEGSGQINISFASTEELNRILEIIED